MAEISMYVLFILCFIHALKQGVRHISYLLGGLIFGLMLEYINLLSNLGYTYGKFMIMLGNPPLEIPFCIGVGWSIIMYTARLFTDRFQLPLWCASAVDALLAISIDLSMDAVAYRLHMWHWNWNDKNPLTSDWFGVPFDNFFGWLMVVFFYSSTSRLFEAFLSRKKAMAVNFALVPLASVIVSQVFLYVMIVYVDVFLKDNFGITPLHRFITFLIILIIVAVLGIRRRKLPQSSLPVVTWLVPVWFHFFFFTWLFIGGFYSENVWLVIAAILNILLATGVHILSLQNTSFKKSFPMQIL